MASVLFKKIGSSGGLPPTLLYLGEFWDLLQSETKNWILEVVGQEIDPIFSSRNCYSSKAEWKPTSGEIFFRFNKSVSPGLRIILLDEALASQIAIRRLAQKRPQQGSISPLLLRLMAEEPITKLWWKLSDSLVNHTSQNIEKLGIESFCEAELCFEPNKRYARAVLNIVLDENQTRISLFFDMDYLQSYLRHTREDEAAQTPAASPESKAALLDTIMASQVTMNVALELVEMTIGECSRIDIGSVLPLPGVNTEHMKLVAETKYGPVELVSGELGIWKRQRALKLHGSVSSEFINQLVMP